MKNSSKLIFLGILILAVTMIALIGGEREVFVGDNIEGILQELTLVIPGWTK